MTARRDFLAFAAGAVAAKTVLPAAAGADLLPTGGMQAVALPIGGERNPDAELLALCAAFVETDIEHRRFNIEADASPESEAWGDDLHDRWWAPVDRLIDMPALTPEGLRAKANATRLVIEDLAVGTLDGSLDTDGSAQDRLAWSLCRDILGRA